MKPVRLLCESFVLMFLWTLTRHNFQLINSIHIIWLLLDNENKNVAFIYSVIICDDKTKDCAPWPGGASNIICNRYCCFYL